MKSVLIVEDNELVLQLLVQLLEEIYDVRTASDGKSGAESARLRPPDIVLMDLTMPVMDGWTAIRQLRTDPKTAGVPVIALSGRSETDAIERAFVAGASIYVPKPIDDQLLLSEIARLLAGPRATTGNQMTRAGVAAMAKDRAKQGS